jgi:hypothetical protein
VNTLEAFGASLVYNTTLITFVKMLYPRVALVSIVRRTAFLHNHNDNFCRCAWPRVFLFSFRVFGVLLYYFMYIVTHIIITCFFG